MATTQPNLPRLNAQRKRLHITIAMVAVEAARTSKTGTCGEPTVSRALSGHDKNANVVGALRRLFAAAKSQAVVA